MMFCWTGLFGEDCADMGKHPELLSAYGFSVEKRLSGVYPKRDYQTQYNETDYVF
jgi:hypothetical protein